MVMMQKKSIIYIFKQRNSVSQLRSIEKYKTIKNLTTQFIVKRYICSMPSLKHFKNNKKHLHFLMQLKNILYESFDGIFPKSE